jgi:hypothetical protein
MDSTQSGTQTPAAHAKSDEQATKIVLVYVEKTLTARIEQAKATEAVFADLLASARIVDIDEHVLFWMTGEKAREYLYELFLLRGVGMHETVTDKKPMRSLGAV